MSKEMSQLQKKRQRSRARREAEHKMDSAREPSGGADIARRVGKKKSELKHRDKAAEEFRRR